MTATTATKAPAKKAAAKKAGKPAFRQTEDPALIAPQMIAIADIDTSHNPRTDMAAEDTRELADSIAAVGLEQPIRVEDTGSTPPYRLIYGGRRVAAHQMLGREFIAAQVQPAGAPSQSTRAARLIENLQRVDLNPVDEANAIGELVDEEGMKQVDVATLLGRNQGYVSKRLALRKLIGTGQRMVIAGDLSLEHAVDLAKFPAGIQSDCLASIQRGQSPATVIHRTRDRIALLAERGRILKALQKAGTPVIDRAQDRKPLPDDVRKVAWIDDEAWQKDPGRLAVLLTDKRSWEATPAQWIDRYTTTPLPEPAQVDEAQSRANGAAVGAFRDEVAGGSTDRPAEPAGVAERRTEEDRERDRIRAEAARETEERRQAAERRSGELRAFITTLVTGKANTDAWSRFLIRQSLIESLLGARISADDGIFAQVSVAATALGIETRPELEGPDLHGLYDVLAMLLTGTASPDQQLRLTLGAKLLAIVDDVASLMRGLGTASGGDVTVLYAGEALAFLQEQGLELTEAEASVAARRHAAAVSMAWDWDLLTDAGVNQLNPDDDEQQEDAGEPAGPDEAEAREDLGADPGEAAFEAAITEEVPAPPVITADLPAADEPDVSGLEEDFDAPVSTFRPDLDAAARRDAALAEIASAKRPRLVELCREHGIETTPKTTAVAMQAKLRDRLTDPADSIA